MNANWPVKSAAISWGGNDDGQNARDRILIDAYVREQAKSDSRLCKRCGYVECVCGVPAFEQYEQPPQMVCPSKLLDDLKDALCVIALVAVAMALLAGFGGGWLR